jgi:hypothetical protein
MQAVSEAIPENRFPKQFLKIETEKFVGGLLGTPWATVMPIKTQAVIVIDLTPLNPQILAHPHSTDQLTGGWSSPLSLASATAQ